MSRYLMGYDIGSSSIKASVIDIESGKLAASASSPDREMDIISIQKGFAEQNPEDWWNHVKLATAKIKNQSGIDLKQVEAIGISYQMHGLVVVDKDLSVLRPAIIWCDSRAVEIGDKAFIKIGKDKCFERLLNSPGNFTASKLKWVKENEPDIYKKIYKIMLPGDYIAMKFTNEILTSYTGLSEGIFWDYKNNNTADFLLDEYKIQSDLLPAVKYSFSDQGSITDIVADELGFKKGIKITYRAGDQPNNAFSLNVLDPGQIAATAGTSGVIYGILDKPAFDPEGRVNVFIHVNHKNDSPRYGVLLCLNGTGILYRWLKNNYNISPNANLSYDEMNSFASKSPAGALGLFILPYGNGAERTLQNKNIGASINGLNFNIHSHSHILRAAQEGIIFGLNYGFKIMKKMDVKINTIKAGMTNMFSSDLFQKIFASVTGVPLELYNTDGSQGAARGAGVGAGIYNLKNAFDGLKKIKVVEPDIKLIEEYKSIYEEWFNILQKQLIN
jgi:xylulokinase